MGIQKASSFIFRFIVTIFLLLFISLIVKSFLQDTNIAEENEIPFLGVSDKTVDSVVLKLTLHQKLNLIFIGDTLNMSNLLPEENSSADSIVVTQHLLAKGKGVQSEPQNFLNNKSTFCFLKLDKLPVLNAISDTSILADYLLKLSLGPNFKIINLNLNIQEINSLHDSLFSIFFINRFRMYNRVLHKNNRLLGISVNYTQIKKVDSLFKSFKPDAYNVANLFKKSLDVLFIDSVDGNFHLPFMYNGLVVIRKGNNDELKEESVIQMLNSHADIIQLSPLQLTYLRSAMVNLIKEKPVLEKQIDKKIRKIIKAKLWMEQGRAIVANRFVPSNAFYNHKLAQLSIALLNNPDSLLPVKDIYKQKFTLVWLGKSIESNFTANCKYYTQVSLIQLFPGKNDWQKKLGNKLKQQFLIFAIDTLLKDTSDLMQLRSIMGSLNPKSAVIVNFKNYANLKIIPDSFATMQIQSNSPFDYMFAAQAIFGGISMQGQLPYTISNYYTFGLRKHTLKTRLKYSIPEEVGIDASKLEEIDRIAYEGISGGAFPGCQIFVAKNGQVIYNKSFGNQSYLKGKAVDDGDLYDLASVTKIAATTIAAMKMISDGKMSLNDQLGKFFRDTKIDYTRIQSDTLVNIDTFYHSAILNWKTFLKNKDTLNINDTSFVTIDTIITKLTPRLNIFKVPIIDLLKHQSGILPALPVFKYIYYRAYFIKRLKDQLTELHGKTGHVFDYKSFDLPNDFPDNTKLEDSIKRVIKKGFNKQYDEYFSRKYAKDSSDIRLTDNLYLRNKYFDTIWHDTKQLPVFSRKVFIYSDINMILLQFAIDSLNHMSIDEFMKKRFYHPLGLKTISFLPLKYYSKDKIVPTEMDNSWRYGYLHGYVHDPSASLLGGMAGNAGLYSNAHDFGVLFQMILNKGTYGGNRYIKPSVIKQFTSRNDDTQRGLGFDMPNRKAIIGSKASKNSYGHSGYTGTCVWVDPDNELVYVFLSNRNNPNPDNWRIISLHIRERIHNAVYAAFIPEN